MKNFKKIALALVVGAIAVGFSAFTSNKNVNSNFYVYGLASTAQADIQNFNNYAASSIDPCGGTTTNVCGVTLATARPVGQKPLSSDFSVESGNLWTSQQNHHPADGSIEMKP
jgi:hypothetical protein